MFNFCCRYSWEYCRILSFDLIIGSWLLSPLHYCNVRYWIRRLCRVPAALGKGTFCRRQRLCRVRLSAKPTRQRSGRQRNLCRVPRGRHSAKDLPSATPALGKGNGRRQLDGTLCRVPTCQALGKGIFFLKISSPSADVSGTQHFFLKKSLPSAGTRQRFGHFAECHASTRQSWALLGKMPSFAECWHSAKLGIFFLLFFCFLAFQTCNFTYIHDNKLEYHIKITFHHQMMSQHDISS